MWNSFILLRGSLEAGDCGWLRVEGVNGREGKVFSIRYLGFAAVTSNFKPLRLTQSKYILLLSQFKEAQRNLGGQLISNQESGLFSVLRLLCFQPWEIEGREGIEDRL